MMCSSGILVDCHLCSIRLPTEGLTRTGKDLTLMLHSYLILSLEVFEEDWIERLPNQFHHRPLWVLCVELRIQSQNLKSV